MCSFFERLRARIFLDLHPEKQHKQGSSIDLWFLYTMYFERNGGYEYAKQFYEKAYHFIEKKFGADNVISAVMHADEINVAATEELGKEVYHYHLHTM